jgi:hypothetical protein
MGCRRPKILEKIPGEESMNRRAVFLKFIFIATIGLLLFVGCDDSPAGRLPPPETTYVTPPNPQGYATVSGAAGTAYGDEVVLVYNEDTGVGVMESVDEDGEFEVQVAAEIGDVIVVQIKLGYALSPEQMYEIPAS